MMFSWQNIAIEMARRLFSVCLKQVKEEQLWSEEEDEKMKNILDEKKWENNIFFTGYHGG